MYSRFLEDYFTYAWIFATRTENPWYSKDQHKLLIFNNAYWKWLNIFINHVEHFKNLKLFLLSKFN